jgi:hypothetical protein
MDDTITLENYDIKLNNLITNISVSAKTHIEENNIPITIYDGVFEFWCPIDQNNKDEIISKFRNDLKNYPITIEPLAHGVHLIVPAGFDYSVYTKTPNLDLDIIK